MRRIVASLASTALVLFPAASIAAEESSTPAVEQVPLEGRQPFELVRTLQALQDQTALGNVAAHSAQRPMIEMIGQRLAAAPVEVWQDQRNGRALIAFVLSGGEPDTLKRLMANKIELPGIDEKLAVAAIAFAERRADEARALLVDLDARALEPGLASHVALVQGIVFSEREQERALSKFEEARLFAPGTLVEQGALRRQSILAGKMGRWDEGERLAGQYLRRFGSAVYAPAFYRELAESLANQPDTRDEDQLARLKRLFDQIAEKARRQTYLLLAERAVLGGKVKMARFAAAQASALYDASSTEAMRSQVYGAAANVASERLQDGVDSLAHVDRRKLGQRDSLLADAALELAVDVRREPATAPAEAGISAKPGGGDVAQSKVMDLARKSLDRADTLLKEKR